jgi:hypothetical protein
MAINPFGYFFLCHGRTRWISQMTVPANARDNLARQRLDIARCHQLVTVV